MSTRYKPTARSTSGTGTTPTRRSAGRAKAKRSTSGTGTTPTRRKS